MMEAPERIDENPGDEDPDMDVGEQEQLEGFCCCCCFWSCWMSSMKTLSFTSLSLLQSILRQNHEMNKLLENVKQL